MGRNGYYGNRAYYPHLLVHRWNDLWNPQLKNQILMLDEMKEPFEIALRVLGYPSNSQNPKQIKAAYKKLIALMPNIKLFNIMHSLFWLMVMWVLGWFITDVFPL